ncbi:MAG: thiol:disulfide interchange protein DsbA/DsbL [Pelomonas sp.]|nr:thiol:disulfide interchange protein DsbA/DsbL [Roseateles sp.]
MQRREFNSLLALAGLAASPLAMAQADPVEGRQFRRLSPPLPTAAGNKVEVLEMFMYTCPHCFKFDTPLAQWAKAHAADVSLRRIAVGANTMTGLTQKMFFALQAMGVEEALHTPVFSAIHVGGADVTSESGVFDLAARLQVDMGKFKQAYNSFAVSGKCRQANQLMQDTGIDSVPTLIVGGRFVTSPSMAGTPGASEIIDGQRALQVADALVKRAKA